MKHTILILLVTLISSCANIDTSRIAPGYVEAFRSLKGVFLGVESNINPELIDNIPYASMLVTIGNGPQGLMILESINNEDQIWVSADGVYIVINRGRIVKTYGLTNNLDEKLSPLKNWEEISNINNEFVSYNSYSSPSLNNLKVNLTYSTKGTQEVKLLTGNRKLKLIKEKVVAEEVGWKKTNLYWLDQENFVWKSVQNISPILPPIYIEITKKPR